MVNSFGIRKKFVQEEMRFNPKFYAFYSARNELLSRSDIKFKTLGDIEYFPVLSDGIHSAVNLTAKGEIKYLYVKNLKEGFIDITDNNFLDPIDHKKNLSKELKDKDVLISVVGSMGETAMFSKYVDFTCSLPRNIGFIRTNPEKILPEFLTCFFLSKFSKEQSIYSAGGNIQGLLSLTKLKKFVIPILDMETQALFANEYTKAIVLQDQFLLKLEEAKKVFYNSLDIDFSKIEKNISFTSNIKSFKQNKIWTASLYNSYAEQVLAKISEKYKVMELVDITTIKKGHEIGSENYEDYLSKSQDSVPFIRTSDIFNYEINSYPSYYADKSVYEDFAQDFKTGDIIINNDGKIGYPTVITSHDKAIYQSHIKRLRMKKDYKHLSYYVFLCLIVPEVGGVQFDKYTVIQTTIPTLANRIEKIRIPILDEEVTNKINRIVEEAFSLLNQKKLIMKNIKHNINEILNYK